MKVSPVLDQLLLREFLVTVPAAHFFVGDDSVVQKRIYPSFLVCLCYLISHSFIIATSIIWR